MIYINVHRRNIRPCFFKHNFPYSLPNPKPPLGRVPSILQWAKYRICASNFWSTVEIIVLYVYMCIVYMYNVCTITQ